MQPYVSRRGQFSDKILIVLDNRRIITHLANALYSTNGRGSINLAPCQTSRFISDGDTNWMLEN